jgi:hypothetical protein
MTGEATITRFINQECVGYTSHGTTTRTYFTGTAEFSDGTLRTVYSAHLLRDGMIYTDFWREDKPHGYPGEVPNRPDREGAHAD